jgi:hypothetical protein
MQASLITHSPEELFAISPEVRNRLRKAIMPKQVLVSTHTLIEQVPDDKETSITVPDVYETYINSLAAGERPVPLNVAQESYAKSTHILIRFQSLKQIDGIEHSEPHSEVGARVNSKDSHGWLFVLFSYTNQCP